MDYEAYVQVGHSLRMIQAGASRLMDDRVPGGCGWVLGARG